MQREPHLDDGQRLSGEVIRVDRRGAPIKNDGVYAVGSIAFNRVYTSVQGARNAPPARNWQVEREYKGVWVTASKAWQGKTLAEAQNIARGCAGYRVVYLRSA